MKKHLIALAVALSLSSPVLAADNPDATSSTEAHTLLFDDGVRPRPVTVSELKFCFTGSDPIVALSPTYVRVERVTLCNDNPDAAPDLVTRAHNCELISGTLPLLSHRATACTGSSEVAHLDPPPAPPKGMVIRTFAASDYR